MLRYLLDKFTSKKFASALLAYSVLILSGAGVVTFPAYVLDAAATALIGHIVVQGAVDAVAEFRGRNDQPQP